MSLINIIGNIIPVFTGGIVLPACAKDLAVAWYRDLNNILVNSVTIDGLLDFDGVDDYVRLSSQPDVTGIKTVSFKTYLEIDDFTTNESLFSFGGISNDHLTVNLLNSTMEFFTSNNASGVRNASIDITGLDLTILNVVVTKGIETITSVTINGESKILTYLGKSANELTPARIGDSVLSNSFLENAYIWDININDEHAYAGQPSGNLDSAWVDTIGSIDGTVNGSPATTSITDSTSYTKDSIGTRTDTVYHGQYLTSASGQINFFRSSGTFDYTDPSDGSLVEGVSIPGTGLYTIPANGVCDIGVYPRVGGDVIDTDGIDDYIEFSSVPDVTGSKTISFKAYISSTVLGSQSFIFKTSSSDFLRVYLQSGVNANMVVSVLYDGISNGTWSYDPFSIGDLDKEIEIIITKTTGSVTSTTVEGTPLGINLNYPFIDWDDNQAYIGRNDRASGTNVQYYASNGSMLIWDLNINNVNSYSGIPNGNTNNAWVDNIGSINGTVYGSPNSVSIGAGDYDLEYTSFYPTAERAGTVLHDVMQDSHHISISTPTWAETVYGSDYLNQYGYVDKADSDSLAYTWETTVNGSQVTLDNNTLVPLARWTYEDLIDSNGDPILDSGGNQIQVKVNI